MADLSPRAAELEARAEGASTPSDLLVEPTAAQAGSNVGTRRLAGVSVGTGVVTIWLGLLGLITTPILIHRLGATRYGVFALITIMSAYLSNLEFGFGYATVRFLARAHAAGDRDEQTRIMRTSFAVFLTGGLVAAAVAVAGSSWIDRTFFHGPVSLRAEAGDAIRLGALILLFSFLSSFASSGLQAISRFHVVVGTRAAFGTLASATAVAAVLVGGHLRLILAAQAGVGAALCLVLYVSLLRATGIRLRPQIDPRTFRALSRFGIFVVVSGLAYQLLLQGPPTVLAHYASTSQVAAFAVPNLVLQQLAVLATATSVGFMPFVSAASISPDHGHLGDVYRSNLRMTLLAMGPVAIFLAVFAHPLLSTWIGPAFATKASAPLQFLSLAAVMLALSSAPADVARGLGSPRWVAVFTICAAAVAVGTAFVLAPAHGARGVAIALAVGLTAANVPFIVLVGRGMLQLSLAAMVESLARPAAGLLLVAVLFEVADLISGSFAAAVIAGALAAIAYPLLSFKLILHDRERATFIQSWRHIVASVRGFGRGLRLARAAERR